MSRTSSNFFKRLGLLIPGFKGYQTKEDLRESDYQIRLYAKQIIEKLVDKIEKEKRNLNSNEFLDIDFQQKDLALKVTLTLGADAANSSLSSNIINVTDNISSEIAVINGIPAAVFTAASSGGVSGFIHAQDNISGTRSILVDKVVMTQGNTLNLGSYALPTFSLSQNPIEDTVQLRGGTTGSEISIYSVNGAIVNNYVYDGNQLSLGHLNPGVYFLEVSGFTSQKLIKK